MTKEQCYCKAYMRMTNCVGYKSGRCHQCPELDTVFVEFCDICKRETNELALHIGKAAVCPECAAAIVREMTA